MKKAIILVSFGTSDLKALEKSILNIENNLKCYFSDYIIKRAFTSKIIISKLKEKNIRINNLEEVLEELISLKLEEVIIQPLHIIAGNEYFKIVEIFKLYNDKFKNIKLGTPLFSLEEGKGKKGDFNLFLKYMKSFLEKEEEIIILGHGSKGECDILYNHFYDYLIESGYNNIYLCTIEGEFNIDKVIKKLKDKGTNKVFIFPLMISLGFHFKRDILNCNENSLNYKLKKYNIYFQRDLRGVGEYNEFSKIYIEKIKLLIDE